MRYVLLDQCDPAHAAAVFHREPGMLWLDSADPDHPSSRWSYLCVAPVSTMRLTAQATETEFAASMDMLRRWVTARPRTRISGGPPFQGGAAGYVAYDAALPYELAARVLTMHLSLWQADRNSDELQCWEYDNATERHACL